MKASWIAAVVAAAAVGASLAGLGTGTARAQGALEQSAQAREHWQDRYRKVLLAERRANARLVAAEEEWSRMRSRNRDRGAPRIEGLEAIEEARAALAKAARERAAFPEEARRAGVPPGWLRTVEDELDQEPAATP